MRSRWVTGIGILLLLLAAAWLIYGGIIYWRNRPLPVDLPQVSNPSATNVYDQLIAAVQQVKLKEQIASLASYPNNSSVTMTQVASANRDLLSRIRDLLQQPSWVSRLEVQIGDPTLGDFQQVARLFVIEGKQHERQGRYAQALNSYLDGLALLESISRGGDTLHLTFQFVSGTEIFSAVPSVVNRLQPIEALQGAQRIEQLLREEYPLRALLSQEFRKQLQGWNRSVELMSKRGFQLRFPRTPLEKQMLMRPKREATLAALQYAKSWIEEVQKPYPEQQVVPYPSALQSFPEGLIIRTPEEVALHVARYTYVRTRLRLLYTALRLEAYRKTHGRYPASLKDLGDSPYFIDPFSNKPFVYRSQGNSYVLYSLGPNSRDDGGASFPEGRLRREQPGDIGLVPNLPSRPS